MGILTGMQLYTEPLDGEASSAAVLRRLEQRSRQQHLAPPAALTGEWFSSAAVLAPTVHVTPSTAEFGPLATTAPRVARPNPTSPTAAVGGGWIGFLGFPDSHPTPRRLPRTAWGWADHVLRLDTQGRWWFESLRAQPPPQRLIAELAAIVRGPEEPVSDNAGIPGTSPTVHRPDAERHHKAVHQCVAEIAAGEIFQANICCRFSVHAPHAHPAHVFARGIGRFAPARAAYVAGDWGAVASLSPELFLSRTGNEVRTRPIKGTLPRRGPDDDGNADALRRSTKDIAENVMILDMARNDLGRVARTGSVTVPQLLDVEAHPGVWHLVSEARADVPTELTDADLLRATFPPASVTGAPKSRALEIIPELEAAPRGVYCGSVGMVSPLRGMELNVAIRTLEHRGGTFEFGVGGGITADSDPEAEWRETLTKAAPQLSTLGVHLGSVDGDGAATSH